MINNVQISGYLVSKEPIIMTQTGTYLLKGIVEYRKINKKTNEVIKDRIPFTVFGTNAALLNEMPHDSMLLLTGTLSSWKSIKQDREDRYYLQFQVFDVQVLVKTENSI